MNRIGRLLPGLVLGLGLLCAGLSASAQQDEGDSGRPNYARTGFYIAAGGVNIIPQSLEEEFDSLVGTLAPPPGWFMDPERVPQDGGPPVTNTLTTFEGSVQSQSTLGLFGRAGWRFHPHFAVEAHYEFISDFRLEADGAARYPFDDVNTAVELQGVTPVVIGMPGSDAECPPNEVGCSDDVLVTSGTRLLEGDGWTATANAKAWLLTGRFQPFLYVGVGAMHAEAEDGLADVDWRRTIRAPGPQQQRYSGTSVLKYETSGTELVGRFGGGLDVYVSEDLAFTFDAAYLLPRGDLKDFDYVSVSWGLQYRF